MHHFTRTGIYGWYVSGMYAVAMPHDASTDTMFERCSSSGARSSLITVPIDVVVGGGVQQLSLRFASQALQS